MGWDSFLQQIKGLGGNEADTQYAIQQFGAMKALNPNATSATGGLGEAAMGLLSKSTGTALIGDALGMGGNMLGSSLMKAFSGGGASQAESATKAAADAAQTMIDKVAQNKSSLLQNTNAMGQQGPQAAMEAQRRMNSQMLSGDAVAAMNDIKSKSDTLISNSMGLAQSGMKAASMGDQNLRDMVRNMAGAGGGVAKLGNLAGLSGQSAANKLNAFNSGANAMQSAVGQAGQMAAQVSDIRNQDLASNFERNVKPALNNWENFQGMASQLANSAATTASSISNSADNPIYNALGGTAKKFGTDAGQQSVFENTMRSSIPMAFMNQFI